MTGKKETINFLPRSLKWYILLYRYRVWLRLASLCWIAVCIGICVVWATAQNRYVETYGQWKELNNGGHTKSIISSYEELEGIKEKMTELTKTGDGLYYVVTLLDTAMQFKGTVSIRRIECKEHGFIVEGTGHDDDVCQRYMKSVQGKLRKVKCSGKHQRADISGYCSFRLEGFERDLRSESDKNDTDSAG